MTLRNATWLFHDDGPDYNFEQINYPILESEALNTITKWEVSGGITLQTQAMIVETTYQAQPYTIGLQYGPAGYTPWPMGNNVAIALNTSFFATVIPTTNWTSWSDETAVGGMVRADKIYYKGFPQLVVPTGGMDVYLSVAPYVDVLGEAFFGFRLFASVRMWVEDTGP